MVGCVCGPELAGSDCCQGTSLSCSLTDRVCQITVRLLSFRRSLEEDGDEVTVLRKNVGPILGTQTSSSSAAAQQQQQIAAPCTVTAKPECTKRKHDRSIVSVALCFNNTKWLTLPSNERSLCVYSEPWRTGAMVCCVCAGVRVRAWCVRVRVCGVSVCLCVCECHRRVGVLTHLRIADDLVDHTGHRRAARDTKDRELCS